jgi:HSP20 family protein
MPLSFLTGGNELSWDIEPYDWFRKFFPSRRGVMRPGSFDDIFKGFEEMQREMDRELEDMKKNVPKDLVREYNSPEGGKVQEVGPLVYGYSMTIGPDGKPRVAEFGNVKRPKGFGFGLAASKPEIAGEMEPLIDVVTTDKEIKVTVEMPGVAKDKIKIDAYDTTVEVKSEDPQRKYHKTIDLPPETDIETAKSKYNNGILEIAFDKKKESKPKGKQIKID